MMTVGEEGDPDLTTHHHLLDWLEDSLSFLPSFLDEPYCIPDDISSYDWWDHDQTQGHPAQPLDTATDNTNASATVPSPASITIPSASAQLPKKRKQLGGDAAADGVNQNQRRRTGAGCGEGDGDNGEEQRKGAVGRGKKASSRSSGIQLGNAGGKDARWAEHLLNPWAVAMEARNLSRVQHLLFVLCELASPSGDANHRLAAHGLRAITHHLAASGVTEAVGGIGRRVSAKIRRCGVPYTFASTEPRLFRSALIKFQEVSPWFAFPNSLANASILQAVAPSHQVHPGKLHIVDVGVSHGIQWPTLLEALTRRPGGPPALVRLTTVAPRGDAPAAPFAAAPPGYDSSSHLLRYAKSINLNLEIDHAPSLDSGRTLAGAGAGEREGTLLVVCAQFRLHQLRHDGGDDEREGFLAAVRDMGPDLVVLSEVEGECCCAGCCGGGGGYAAGFGRRVEFLWQFLESTSAAFKGRDSGERRVLEGEAARAVVEPAGTAVAAGGREWWRERMVGMGFRGERFCDDALDGGRALLRKYDGNWEMRVDVPTSSPASSSVCLCWKGKPVSFCSLWKPPPPAAC